MRISAARKIRRRKNDGRNDGNGSWHADLGDRRNPSDCGARHAHHEAFEKINKLTMEKLESHQEIFSMMAWRKLLLNDNHVCEMP